MKKPFKETTFGKIICAKIPQAAATVGDLLPDSGVLGVVKNLISGSSLSPEEKKQLLQMQNDFELELLKVEQADKASSRAREIDFVRATGHIDWLMTFVCIGVVTGFIFCLYAAVYIPIPVESKDSFLEMRTTVRDAIILIIGYYWGSSYTKRQAVAPGN